MNTNTSSNKLALKMAIALVCGLVAGFSCIVLREHLISSGNQEIWNTINNLLFQDITAQGAENAIGIFYNCRTIVCQCLAVDYCTYGICFHYSSNICNNGYKEIWKNFIKNHFYFLKTTIFALIWAGIVGTLVYQSGAFQSVQAEGIAIQEGATGSNPLIIILNIIPNNLISAFTQNGNVLAIVFLAVCIGLAMNQLKDKTEILSKLFREVDKIISLCLSFIITKFAPIAIFALLTRTFAIYGIEYLLPALAYLLCVFFALFAYLLIGFPLYILIMAKVNPKPFIKKTAKVALFGFSTSSSAATLPLNKKTCVEELGVHKDIASFTLPLGMTINMDGTAIMQVIAALFVAISAGYDVTFTSMAIIAILALISSIGTPAAPGAGAVILFTILTGMGYTNDAALLAYSLILAINRPIEMLVTSLNVIGDASTSVIVAKKRK